MTDIARSVRITKRERKQRRMKPELIYVDAHDGMVTMKKEDLEALVEKAYQAGRSEVRGTITIPRIDPMPTTPYYSPITCNTEGKGCVKN